MRRKVLGHVDVDAGVLSGRRIAIGQRLVVSGRTDPQRGLCDVGLGWCRRNHRLDLSNNPRRKRRPSPSTGSLRSSGGTDGEDDFANPQPARSASVCHLSTLVPDHHGARRRGAPHPSLPQCLPESRPYTHVSKSPIGFKSHNVEMRRGVQGLGGAHRVNLVPLLTVATAVVAGLFGALLT